MDALKYIFFLGLFCVSECNNMHGVVAPSSYDERLRASQIEKKSTLSRTNVFQAIIDGITNFPDFFSAKKSILRSVQPSEKQHIMDLFDKKEEKLEYDIRKRALFAGAVGKAATDIARSARLGKINKSLDPAGFTTYITEVIACKRLVLYSQETFCTLNFVRHYDPVELLKILLENGGDPNQREGNPETDTPGTGRTVLMLAADVKSPELVRELLKYGADPRATFKGYTALDVAKTGNAGGSNKEVIAILQNAMGAKVK